jgi:hypothetical protein
MAAHLVKASSRHDRGMATHSSPHDMSTHDPDADDLDGVRQRPKSHIA